MNRTGVGRKQDYSRAVADIIRRFRRPDAKKCIPGGRFAPFGYGTDGMRPSLCRRSDIAEFGRKVPDGLFLRGDMDRYCTGPAILRKKLRIFADTNFPTASACLKPVPEPSEANRTVKLL